MKYSKTVMITLKVQDKISNSQWKMSMHWIYKLPFNSLNLMIDYEFYLVEYRILIQVFIS